MPGSLSAIVPYCGTPPTPLTLAGRWNLDPVLIGALIALAALYVILACKGRFGISRLACFGAGWAIAAAALLSPLCALSVSLFSARIGQHMILVLAAAPLLALAVPHTNAARWMAKPVPAAGAFAVLLWFWHAPGPYAATFESTTVYWAMHVSLVGTAVWLWAALFDRSPAGPVPALAAGLATSVQMGFLGALILFAPHPLYRPHATTTSIWDLTQLQDQQLGGAIMWVPGCAILLAGSLAMLRQALARGPRPLPADAAGR